MPGFGQPEMRRFGDHEATKNNIYDGALGAVQSLPPVENQRYKLSIQDPGWTGSGEFGIADHKNALLTGRTLGRRLSGTFTLTDKATNSVVDSRRMTVASVPALTRQGTFILDGNATILAHQMRLLPGVYARKKNNGTYESHVNFLPSKGVPHRLVLDPETGVFKINVGQAEIPAVSLMKVMGVTKEDLEQRWGPELAAINLKADKPHHLDKLYERMGPAGPVPETPHEKAQALAAKVGASELDSWVSKRTLGQPHKFYDKHAMLAATGKLLDIAKGRAEPDDRDNPVFSMVWGPEHLIAERIERSKPLMAKMLWQATNSGHLRRIQPGPLSPAVRAAFTKSGLGLLPEGTSAAEFMDHGARITKVGEGGIGKSAESVPMSARNVSSGQFPFIDPVRTSECFDAETEVLVRSGWKKWPEVTDDDEFACTVDGRLEFHKPLRLHAYDYSGTMHTAAGEHIEYMVTPNHRFRVRLLYKDAPWVWMTAEEVHERTVQHRIGGHAPLIGDDAAVFTPPVVESEKANDSTGALDASHSRMMLGGRRLSHYHNLPIAAFAELLGWYLGEGTTYIRTDKKRNNCYRVRVSQSDTANPTKVARIAACLDELGVAYKYYPSAKSFFIVHKQLATYFKQFGYSTERWIPEEFLRAPIEARRRLFEALLLAEGTLRKSKNGYGTFSSTSPQLAADFARLAFSLGHSTHTTTHRDKREERYALMYLVTIHSREVRQLCKARRRLGKDKPSDYSTAQYTGKVYCATVPGSQLYVRRGSGSGFWSGNSESVGVDLRVAFGTKIGKDRRIYAPVKDAKTGKLVYRSPQDLADKTVAFPNAHLEAGEAIPVIRGGKLTYAPRHEVHYNVPSMEQSFSPLTNMVPMKSAAKPHRASMGARMLSQSIPLDNVEAPWVRSQVPGQPGKSFEELFGRHMGAEFADDHGVVDSVEPGKITVRYANGARKEHEIYHYLPAGRKTSLHATPLVKPGDQVQPGQILAKSNYTDDKGHAAYGLNARTAFMNHPGVYEDSVAISQSFANRMKSDHLYKHELFKDEDTTHGKHAHAAAFPGKYPLEMLKAFGDDGVIKPGTVVNKDDPLILAVRKRKGEFGRLSRSGKTGMTDASETWHYDEPGIVTDALQGPHGPVVTVRSQKTLQSGDKVAGRHGNKGIAVVFPDHEMPHGADGNPVDVILSSLGTIARGNPAGILEAALGKIARKTGQPYVFDDFRHGNDVSKFVQNELAKHGVSLKEDLTDPKTGRKIPGVSTGDLYLMKLSHIAEAKSKGRGLGATDESGQPTRGQNNGAMRMSLGDTNALLSSGATSVIHDAHNYRGQANPDFWLSYMAGFPTPKPTKSDAFNRFLTELRASGVDPVHKDSRYHLMALTNKRVKELAGDREVRNGETLDFSKNGEPYAGGLHDPRTFGAVDSMTTWGHIPLHEPMLNPVMEEPARRLLGLTESQFRDVIAHKHNLPTGTGPKAIADALGKIDVAKELTKTRELANSGRKTVRDDANRKLVYLKGLEKNKQDPKDWVLDSAPVLPPGLRPVSEGPGGVVVHDANLLYSDLFAANDALKKLSKETADVGAEKLNLYDSVKAVMGLGDPVGAKNKERGVRGILSRLLGDTAKHGFYQQKLLGSPTNLSGRAQALPNPDLDMDEVGVPESMAWSVYHPFVVRRMVRQGIPRAEAARMASEKHAKAKQALVDEMGERPIIMTRYPALHRHSVMAFNPRLMVGSGVHVNNLVTKPYGGDFDGDAYTLNVPLSDEAVKEAREKLFPSKNLFSPSSMKASTFTPNMEYMSGLHLASVKDHQNDPVEFPTLAAARAAAQRGDIDLATRIRILSEEKRPT